jgi:phenol 2-monooxygenase
MMNFTYYLLARLNTDKADAPLAAGRADGVQPRFLETIAKWGLAAEIQEEGPIIERTAMYMNGEKLLFNRSHQSDSRYRGLHVITQGQIERIYIRDLLRHRCIVERSRSLAGFGVRPRNDDDDQAASGDHAEEEEQQLQYPVRATVQNHQTGEEELIQAKFLVGSDGASSSVRKSLGIPFDGVSTDVYWGIMDCIFETDYPHAWVFG